MSDAPGADVPARPSSDFGVRNRREPPGSRGAMTETAVPKRRRTSSKPGAPAVAPETAPDLTPHPAPRQKDAPRTMKDLRAARQTRRKTAPRQDDNPLREGLRLERVPDP